MEIIIPFLLTSLALHMAVTAILYLSDLCEFNDGSNIIRGRHFPYNNLESFFEKASLQEIYDWFLWQPFWSYHFIARYIPASKSFRIARAIKNRAVSEIGSQLRLPARPVPSGGELSLADIHHPNSK